MTKNVERGRATRERLVEVATRLFAGRGYEGTSIEAVLRESGMSRGSLYHHFPGKDALFRAVLEGVETRVGADLAAAMKDVPDAAGRLRAGCLEWIRLARDPAVQQIMLIDAPAVLGWERWRELDERNTLGGIKATLRRAADDGRLDGSHVEMFAHILLAAVNEIALLIARSADPDGAMAAGQGAVGKLLDGMLGPP